MTKLYHTPIVYLITFFFMVMTTASLAQATVEGLWYLTKKPVSVEMKDGKIFKITPIKKLSNEAHPAFIAPGLIDNQVNGFAGVSFCLAGGELTKEGIIKATHELWKKGVTTYLPTLTSNSREVLVRNFTLLAKTKNDPELNGSIVGYHLEGPYISPIDGFRGAHPLRHMRKPDWKEFMEFSIV